MKTKFLKKLVMFFVLFIPLNSAFGQTSIFTKYAGSITALTDSQIYKLNLIQDKEEYNEVTLATFNPEAITDPNGIMTIENIDGLDGVRFKSYHVEYQDLDNVNWIGLYLNNDTTVPELGSFMTIT